MEKSNSIVIKIETTRDEETGKLIRKFKDYPGGPIVFADSEDELKEKFIASVRLWCIMKSFCSIRDNMGKGIFNNTVLRPKLKPEIINDNQLELEAR